MDQIKLEMKENTSNGHSSIRTNGISINSSTQLNGSSSEDNHHEKINKRELFLKAFEKPTQIYRYLRARHSISPIFLHRNLWYMKQRTSRDNCKRKTFKVDSLKETVERRLEEMKKIDNQNNHFSNLVIRFSGIKDKTLADKSPVTVNVSLLKMNTKNKHESSLLAYSSEIPIGECKLGAPAADKLTLAKENFISNAKHILVFKVTILKPQSASNHSQHQLTNGNLNGDYANGDLSDKEEIFSAPTANKRRRTCNEVHRYKAELVISGNSPETMLKDGEYNLTLNECSLATNGDCRSVNVQDRFKKKVIWENASKLNSQIKDYLHEPYLSFQLKWSSDLSNELVQQIKPYLFNSKTNHHPISGQPLKQIDPPNNAENSHSNKSSSYPKNSRKFSTASNPSSLLLNGCATNGTANGFAALPKRPNGQEAVSNLLQQQPLQACNGDSKVVYRFIHNNDELQLLKTNSDFMCPWCSIQCFQIFSLKHHLRYIHNRFNFSITFDSKGYKVDVTINESFDGSYCGNPQHDMSNFTSNAKSSHPVQRTPVTLFNLNLRGKRQSLSAFLENETIDIDFDLMKQEVFGHNRLYYHSGTCRPIKPHELDEDSEDERDPEWMRIKTQLMIDEFTDVNEGEKEVMKLWNLHMMKYPFVGWVHVPLACELFIKENWQEIVKRNIYMNFILHLNNLFDYQLLSSDTLRSLIKLFHEMTSEHN